MNLPNGKHAEIALTYIYGIGKTAATEISPNVFVNWDARNGIAIPNDGNRYTVYVDYDASPQVNVTATPSVDIDHTWVSDLKITLKHLGDSVVLWDGNCTNKDDVKVTFKDGAGPVDCTSPITGTFEPEEPLALFIGKEINGNMNVRDAANERHYEVVLQCMDHAYPLDIGLSQFIY